MDINSAINAKPLVSSSKLLENTLNLKVGQQLDAKLINATIQAAQNTVVLSLGDKNITVQSSQPLKLNPGQDIKIQVTQLTPTVEFKILEPLLEAPKNEIRLKLIPTVVEPGSASNGKEQAQPTAGNTVAETAGKAPVRQPTIDSGTIADKSQTILQTGNNAENVVTGKEPMQSVAAKPDLIALAAQTKQPVDAKIINIADNKIQLQINEPSIKQTVLVTIDRSQLTNAPTELKAGQALSLQIIKTGAAPEFKVINPGTPYIPEAKVAEYVKQFLPRHEASPILLNQLIKDLPQLMANKTVPEALKDIAQKIIQNLPPKEQLVTSQGLKQAMTDSGLFLEAKLASVISESVLMNELPQLVKNENVPQSLQRIAAEIMQNLTQKLPLPNNQPITNPIPNNETEATSLPPQVETNTKLPMQLSEQGGIADDFKTNLLKFIQSLKQEISHQTELQLNQTDLDVLKGLQHKSENTVAKLVLDQLMSLPKEDSPKQLWVIDIPFIDRQHADSVKIEVQQDKENKQPTANNGWSVNITITPPGLDTIQCIVSFRDDFINTYFKSRNTKTAELIKHNLDYLKSQLEHSGLKTGQMDALTETQKVQPEHTQQLIGKRLFDDKA